MPRFDYDKPPHEAVNGSPAIEQPPPPPAPTPLQVALQRFGNAWQRAHSSVEGHFQINMIGLAINEDVSSIRFRALCEALEGRGLLTSAEVQERIIGHLDHDSVEMENCPRPVAPQQPRVQVPNPTPRGPQRRR